MQTHVQRLDASNAIADLATLEGERIALTARFTAFADKIGLGYIGACSAAQYKLPCRDIYQRKPIEKQAFGKGRGNIRYAEVEPQSTVFATVDTIVQQQCEMFDVWAEEPEDDKPKQAALRSEWKSIRRDWRALADKFREALPDRPSGMWR